MGRGGNLLYSGNAIISTSSPIVERARQQAFTNFLGLNESRFKTAVVEDVYTKSYNTVVLQNNKYLFTTIIKELEDSNLPDTQHLNMEYVFISPGIAEKEITNASDSDSDSWLKIVGKEAVQKAEQLVSKQGIPVSFYDYKDYQKTDFSPLQSKFFILPQLSKDFPTLSELEIEAQLALKAPQRFLVSSLALAIVETISKQKNQQWFYSPPHLICRSSHGRVLGMIMLS